MSCDCKAKRESQALKQCSALREESKEDRGETKSAQGVGIVRRQRGDSENLKLNKWMNQLSGKVEGIGKASQIT